MSTFVPLYIGIFSFAGDPTTNSTGDSPDKEPCKRCELHFSMQYQYVPYSCTGFKFCKASLLAKIYLNMQLIIGLKLEHCNIKATADRLGSVIFSS